MLRRIGAFIGSSRETGEADASPVIVDRTGSDILDRSGSTIVTR